MGALAQREGLAFAGLFGACWVPCQSLRALWSDALAVFGSSTRAFCAAGEMGNGARPSVQPAASLTSQPSQQRTTPMRPRKSPSHSSSARRSVAQRPEDDAFVPPAARASTPSTRVPGPGTAYANAFIQEVLRLRSLRDGPSIVRSQNHRDILPQPTCISCFDPAIHHSNSQSGHCRCERAHHYPASLTNLILDATHHRSRLTQSLFACCAGLPPYNYNPLSFLDTKRNFRRHGMVSRLLPLLRQADRSRCLLLSSLPTR